MGDKRKILNDFASVSTLFWEIVNGVEGWKKNETATINQFFKLFRFVIEDYSDILNREEKHLKDFPADTFAQKRLLAMKKADEKDVLEAWKDWNTHLIFNEKGYSEVQEKRASNYIARLAGNDADTFINIIEYAMMKNYDAVNPNILPQITPPETVVKLQKTLFRDSPWFDFNKFRKAFGKVYDNIDLKFYYDKILFWSESENRTSANWISKTKEFIQNDARSEKEALACLNSRMRAETKADVLGRSPRAKASALLNNHFKFMQTMPPEFWQNIKPQELIENAIKVSFDYQKSGLSETQIAVFFQQLIEHISQTEGTEYTINVNKITN